MTGHGRSSLGGDVVAQLPPPRSAADAAAELVAALPSIRVVDSPDPWDVRTAELRTGHIRLGRDTEQVLKAEKDHSV